MLWVHFQISHFKIPRYIKFTDEFLLTVTGKVNTLMVNGSVFSFSKNELISFVTNFKNKCTVLQFLSSDRLTLSETSCIKCLERRKYFRKLISDVNKLSLPNLHNGQLSEQNAACPCR